MIKMAMTRVEKAKAYYQGVDGHQRMNCAQSVAAAFADTLPRAKERFQELAMSNAGRAPEGLCGAIYAAQVLLNDVQPDAVQAVREAFLQKAGSLKCKEIRALKRLPCVGCVEQAASSLASSSDPICNI